MHWLQGLNKIDKALAHIKGIEIDKSIKASITKHGFEFNCVFSLDIAWALFVQPWQLPVPKWKQTRMLQSTKRRKRRRLRESKRRWLRRTKQKPAGIWV